MSVVIDTGEVPPGERFDLWADATPRVFEPLAVRPRGDTPFEGRVARHPLGPLTLYRLRADPSRVTRTRAMIGASDPEWVQVSLLLGGPLRRRAGRAPLGAVRGRLRELGLVAPLRRRRAHPARPARHVLPRAAPARQPDRRADRHHDLRGAGRGPARCAGTCARCSPTWGPAAPPAPGLADGLLELVGALYDGTAVVPRAPDALRTLVRGHIDEHLGDPALDPESIAAAHFISRRQLDRLFADGERTVAETIRDRRLERCRRDLEDPARAGDSVLDIATRWGFVSPAHFSRAVPRGLRHDAARSCVRRRCARRRRRSSDRSRSPRPRPRATARRRRRPRAAPGA